MPSEFPNAEMNHLRGIMFRYAQEEDMQQEDVDEALSIIKSGRPEDLCEEHRYKVWEALGTTSNKTPALESLYKILTRLCAYKGART